jgi:hypothetical protein
MHPEDADMKTLRKYVVTEKGIERYETYLAFDGERQYKGDDKHSPDYYHK